MSNEAGSGLPYPQRTISDEFRTLQYIVSQFQTQLDAPHGTVGLHPFGPVNVDGAKTSFTQACKRLREALVSYRDTTLASWTHLVSEPGNYDGLALTNKAPAAVRELDEMRRIADALHEDTRQCQKILLDAAASAISNVLVSGGQSMVVERLKSTAKRLELAHYTDTRTEGVDIITTVTLAGSIIVIDVDIGGSWGSVKVKVSYVSDIEHDERIDMLMVDRLRSGDISGFEELVEEMAVLDRLTRERAPASFIHNTFAVVATLKEIQDQELLALDKDPRLLLKYGSGIALPHARHVGPSSLYFMPAAINHGLVASDWDKLVNGQAMSENVKSVSRLCHWLYYSWEASSSSHCFLPANIQNFCLQADSTEGITVRHPGIQGLDMRFIDSTRTDMGVFWIPYTLVARLEPSLPACMLTVRAIMAATMIEPQGEQTAYDSPRLLENAPTLENLVCSNGTVDTPQIRAWTICRIPIHRPGDLLAVTNILRRQATFNSILASCFTDQSVSAKTYANDPFRIDLLVNSDCVQQGLVLKVYESSDVLIWTHQILGVSADDLANATLTKSAAHMALSKVADISNSIPVITQWLSTNPQ
ncbi:hypothetical protein GGI13_003695 [Coemansia sp. RSA 455]|nr:hypothetical protein GGI13_003695 [Coemansia sp. RSA 455]